MGHTKPKLKNVFNTAGKILFWVLVIYIVWFAVDLFFLIIISPLITSG